MNTLKNELIENIKKIKKDGLYKKERIITSPQNTKINVSNQSDILNFCANNYLGLSNNKKLVHAAKKGIDKFGFGLSSVRFICGTQTIHRELENLISKFLDKEDTILYTSCFDANGGLFETLLNKEDAIRCRTRSLRGSPCCCSIDTTNSGKWQVLCVRQQPFRV